MAVEGFRCHGVLAECQIVEIIEIIDLGLCQPQTDPALGSIPSRRSPVLAGPTTDDRSCGSRLGRELWALYPSL